MRARARAAPPERFVPELGGDDLVREKARARTVEARLEFKPLLERAAEAGSPAARFWLTKFMFRGWFGLQHVPGGVRRLVAMLKETWESDRDVGETDVEAAPAGVTLH